MEGRGDPAKRQLDQDLVQDAKIMAAKILPRILPKILGMILGKIWPLGQDLRLLGKILAILPKNFLQELFAGRRMWRGRVKDVEGRGEGCGGEG